MLFTISLIIFFILLIFRFIYVNKYLNTINKKCIEIADQYLDELNDFRSKKFKNSLTSIFTPSAIKIISSEKPLEKLGETVTEEIPFFKIAKGVFQYYKKDEQIEYLKDRYMLFMQPDIEIDRYKNHSFSYFVVVIAIVAMLNGANSDTFMNIAFYLMIPPVLSGIYKTFILISLKNNEDGDRLSIIMDDYRGKYIFRETEDNNIEVYVNNKIDKVEFTYTSRYSFDKNI